MTETRPRRRSAVWKILGIAGGALFLVAAVFYFWINAVAGARWERMEKDLRGLHKEIEAREPARPPLRGEAVPGRAWDDYTQAMTAKLPDKVLGDFVSRSPQADRAKVEELIASQGAALDQLRTGARKADGRFPFDWEAGDDAKMPPLVQSQRLANLAVSQARILAETGRTRDAAELLIDTCGFGRDIGSHGSLLNEMIGLAVLSISLDEMRAQIVAGRFSREDLAGISGALERLDAQFPRNGQALLSEAAIMGFTFLKQKASLTAILAYSDGGPGDLVSTWRYGFSTRLVEADAFDLLLKRGRQVEKSDAMSWAEAQSLLKDLEKEGRESSNPIVRAATATLGAERVCRQRKAHVRLLRGAIHYRLTGESPDVADPFGAKLLSSKSGNTLKLWSVGHDGVDDGGAGEWNPQKGKDIVIEAPR